MYEYRVKELQAIDNLNWDTHLKMDTMSPDVQIANARGMWVYFDGTPLRVIPTLDIARREADLIANECSVLEYGVCRIEIDRVFDQDEKPEDPSAFEYLIPTKYRQGHDEGYRGLKPSEDGEHYLNGWAQGRMAWIQEKR